MSDRPPPGSAALLVIDRGFLLLRSIVYAGAFFLCVREVGRMVASLAGRHTDVAVNWFASFFGDFRVTFAFAMTGAAAAWALMERVTRKRLIRRYAPYIRNEETSADPRRTSSRLTATGRSPVEDREYE